MRLLILGVGNPLMGDDGFGAAVIRELSREPLPQGIAAVDGGTAGLGLAALITDAEQVIVLDAAEMRKPAGALVQFTPDQVRSRAAQHRLSLHQADLLGALRLLSELRACPPVAILAVQPAHVRYSIALSPEVKAAVSVAVQLIRAKIADLAKPNLSHVA